jgi:hypothetical protein
MRIMMRDEIIVASVFLVSLIVGCGGSGGSGSGGTGGGGTPQDIPILSAITPSVTTAGTSQLSVVLYGSNFENGATVNWNGTTLSSTWVSATELTAIIPANDISSVGSAKVTVVNPNPGGGTSAAQTFTIIAAPAATTWARTVAGVGTPQDVVWDASRGKLYVSIAATDPVAPNTIVAVNPLTGTAGTPVPAGNNPDLVSISSDSSYLWVGLDGDHSVQRFVLPGLTKDISIPMPLDLKNNPQQPVCVQPDPFNPHTVAVIPGFWDAPNYPVGNGVYMYDDSVQRTTFVPGLLSSGPNINWIQWSANESTIYANQYDPSLRGGIGTLNVTPSGVSSTSFNGGNLGPYNIMQYVNSTGLLYSYGYTFNPLNGSLVGSFPFPSGLEACTADASLGRYYCAVMNAGGSTNVSELWVWDLNTYRLLDRTYFGQAETAPVTGSPQNLVRWGNAGLALVTQTLPGYGNGGLFLIDGAAINPSAAPDVPSGAAMFPYSSMASLTPFQAPVGSADVTVTVTGNNFTQDSTACWACNYLQFRFLPTSYVSAQQLQVTIPANLMASSGQLPISVFDTNTNLFSSNSLSFIVDLVSTGATTQVTILDIAGLAMAWDAGSGLLYVGTADYDGRYSDSIVSIKPTDGSVANSQTVASGPYLLNVSADGQYLYAGFAGATEITRFQLPGLGSPLTWPLTNSSVSSAIYWAGDVKVAPVSPHTTAVTLFNYVSDPDETGGVVIYDDNVQRPDFIPGWGGGGQTSSTVYDTLAWSSTDQTLTGASASGYNGGPLSEFQVTQSGASFLAAGTASFNKGEIHSDFGTGLVYSDDGNVANPTTQAIAGTYGASGLVAPDSSLNRVFILGQTSAQANTNDYTLQSFDQKAYTPVSSIVIKNLQGTPLELVRCGASCLALLTTTGSDGSQGRLYLIHDASFVSSNAQQVVAKSQELVQQRSRRISKSDIFRMLRATRAKLAEQ